MKLKTTLFALVALCAAFIVTGCNSTSWTPENTQLAAALVKPVTKNVTLPLLVKNPKLEPVFVSVAATIDAVFMKEGGMTPEDAAVYVQSIAPNASPIEQQAIASGIVDAFNIYMDLFKPKVVSGTDPNLLLVLNSFKTGILEGVALWKAFPAEAAVEAAAIESP